MAVISAYIVLSPQGGSYNALISSDADILEGSGTLDLVLGATALAQVATTNFPVEANGRVRPGLVCGSYRADYYDRLHISPTSFDLGNILSPQALTVDLWNAFFVAKDLESIAESGTDGISTDATPGTLQALEEVSFNILVSTSGPPVIGAAYQYNFTGATLEVFISGRRSVVWPFMPQVRFTENLEWKTDLIRAFGGEQRVALRKQARQRLTYDFFLDANQFARAKAMASAWSHRVYGIPVWVEMTRVGALNATAPSISFNTTLADYRVGGLALVWQSDVEYEVVEITGKTDAGLTLKLPLENSYTLAYLLPLRFGRNVSGVQFVRGSHQYTKAKAEFMVSDNTDLAASWGLPQYLGQDVYDSPNIIRDNLNERILRPQDVVDNGTGMFQPLEQLGFLKSTTALTIHTDGRADRWSLLGWLHARRGKQKAFWLPTWNEDLTIVADYPLDGTSIRVRSIDYNLFHTVKDFMLVLADGTTYYGRITAGIANGDGTETLLLGTTIPQSFTASEVRLLCFLSHVRFDSDNMQLRYANAGSLSLTVPIVEVPE